MQLNSLTGSFLTIFFLCSKSLYWMVILNQFSCLLNSSGEILKSEIIWQNVNVYLHVKVQKAGQKFPLNYLGAKHPAGKQIVPEKCWCPKFDNTLRGSVILAEPSSSGPHPASSCSGFTEAMSLALGPKGAKLIWTIFVYSVLSGSLNNHNYFY